MPYIKQENREKIDEHIKQLVKEINDNGTLCYCIYKMLINLTNKFGKSFKTMSSLLSEVECSKLEFYRREIVPYEDEKIKENGDVK